MHAFTLTAPDQGKAKGKGKSNQQQQKQDLLFSSYQISRSGARSTSSGSSGLLRASHVAPVHVAEGESVVSFIANESHHGASLVLSSSGDTSGGQGGRWQKLTCEGSTLFSRSLGDRPLSASVCGSLLWVVHGREVAGWDERFGTRLSRLSLAHALTPSDLTLFLSVGGAGPSASSSPRPGKRPNPSSPSPRAGDTKGGAGGEMSTFQLVSCGRAAASSVLIRQALALPVTAVTPSLSHALGKLAHSATGDSPQDGSSGSCVGVGVGGVFRALAPQLQEELASFARLKKGEDGKKQPSEGKMKKKKRRFGDEEVKAREVRWWCRPRLVV